MKKLILALALVCGLALGSAPAFALDDPSHEPMPISELEGDPVETADDATDGDLQEEDPSAEETEEEEEEGEPEMWPVYLSLGALGATVLLIIIINAAGRKK